MKPEWFVYFGCVMALIVGLLWSIAGKLEDIRKLLAAANSVPKDSEQNEDA